MFFAANVLKIQHGGWFPLVVPALVYGVMSTWKRGRELVVERLQRDSRCRSTRFSAAGEDAAPARPGTAVFMTARPEGAPPILVHHLKHNKVLHQQIVLLTISMLNTPTISEGEPIEVQSTRRRLLPRHCAVRLHGVAGRPDRAGARPRQKGCR